jgi:hypothetical protein
MAVRDRILKEIEKRNGVLNLKPSWVQRTFLPPGKRLKLNPLDYYNGGGKYGGVSERWMASTGKADNGKLTRKNEGLSFIVLSGGAEVSLKDAIAEAGDVILGEAIMKKYGCLLSFCKFYDFQIPIPLHVHLLEEQAQLVGAHSKPEAYFFPRQLNAITYNADYTYFGLLKGTTKQDIINCLSNWGKPGDNGLVEYSRAFKLKPGTGWNIPAGILHAPGSLVTYEPQRVSDTSSFWQSKVHDTLIDYDMLTKFYPDNKKNDLAYIADSIDWKANLDPDFKANHYHEPVPVKPVEKTRPKGYEENWVVYGSPDFSAKELTVLPGQTVTIKDSAAYGLIMMEGYGSINGMPIETPAMIGYHDLTADEMYVCLAAAQKGVEITNRSGHSPLVMLKHFGPDNPDAKKFL